MIAFCSYWSCELKTCLSLYYHDQFVNWYRKEKERAETLEKILFNFATQLGTFYTQKNKRGLSPRFQHRQRERKKKIIFQCTVLPSDSVGMTTRSINLNILLIMTILFLVLKKSSQDFLCSHKMFLSSEDMVPPSNMIFENKHLKSFQISGGNCIVKDMLKTDLINGSFAT